MLKKRILIPAACLYTAVLTTLSLINLSPITAETPKNSDKVFHFMAYSLLCFLWYTVFKYGYMQSLTKAFALAGIFSISFGILIEYLQGTFTETRQFDVYDILANSLGAILMLLILALINKSEYKKI